MLHTHQRDNDWPRSLCGCNTKGYGLGLVRLLVRPRISVIVSLVISFEYATLWTIKTRQFFDPKESIINKVTSVKEYHGILKSHDKIRENQPFLEKQKKKTREFHLISGIKDNFLLIFICYSMRLLLNKFARAFGAHIISCLTLFL